jgi:DNA invertase Pin-like site-specific DNA recombinase
LEKAGVDDRDIYKEKMSGTKLDRVELRRVLDLLRPQDKSYVWRLDRLARSQLHLLEIAKEVKEKGAELVLLMDNIDTTTTIGKILFGILTVLSEFEKNLIVERSKAGQAIPRKNGVRFGRPNKLTPAIIRQIKLAHEDDQSTTPETWRVLGISKSTYYNALKRQNAA